MLKISPIAKYLTENKVKAYRNFKKDGYVELKNADNKVIGVINKGRNALNNYSYISIDLYKPNEETPFISQYTVIENSYRYFLEQHKFMPVKIEIEKELKDFEKKTSKKESITRGLASNLYIDKLKDSEQVFAERKKMGFPNNYPIYEINKPFKYEFKAHLYYPAKPIKEN